MKNLKIIMFALLCALTRASSYAMDSQSDENTQPKTQHNYSLGTTCIDYNSNCLRQDIQLNNTPVGHIAYIDKYENGVTYRYIESLLVHENMRKKGIGSECMRQFIDQSQRQGIHTLQLQTLGHLIHFYERLGFKEVSDDYIFSNMEKRL